MRNINKLASLLDRAGEYNLADKLDKIAQSYDMTPEQAYESYIKKYKQAIQKNDPYSNPEINPENIISDFFIWCDNKSLQSKDQNTKNYYTRLKYNFGQHAERLKIYYSKREYVFYNNNSLIKKIKRFGLETANDVNEFNARWKQFTDYTKSKRFDEDPQTSPTIFNSPGVQQQLAALYNQLKRKYVNPNNLKIKSQQPNENISEGFEYTIANGGPELTLPDA